MLVRSISALSIVLVSSIPSQYELGISIHVHPSCWNSACPASLIPVQSLGRHRAPGWAPCVMHQLPTSLVVYTWFYIHFCAALWVCPTLSFSSCVHKSILHICVRIPALQMGSSDIFSRFDACVNIQHFIFSSDLLHSAKQALGSPTWLKLDSNPFHLIAGVILHSVCSARTLYPFMCQQTSRVLACPQHCTWCCGEHWAHVSFWITVFRLYAQ